ncbi:MAG: hypothetical protein KF869_12955 [Phycisphaeraceae bacterium]|nr:hypothetical protein [Phycisphaeraceae bacterium]
MRNDTHPSVLGQVKAIAFALSLCCIGAAAAQPAADSPTIAGAWRVWREALHARAASLDPRDLAERERELSAWLDGLDRRIPVPPAALADVPEFGPAMHQAARAQRESALGRIVARVHPQAPLLDDPAIETDTRAAVTRLNTWYSRAEAFAADFHAARAALDAGFTLEEGGEASPRAVIARWTRDGLLREPAVARAVAPIIERIDALDAVSRLTDSAALLAAARSAGTAHPERLFAAWRRLGERPASPWPAGAQDLQAEVGLRAELLDAAAAIGNKPRAAALAEEVSIAQRQRLVRVLNTSTDDDMLRAAVAAMGAFDVDSSVLDGRVRYNLLLLALKDDVADRADHAARARVLAFIEQAGALPGGVAHLAGALPTVRLLESIALGAAAPVPSADPQRHGPAALDLMPDERDGRIVFVLRAADGNSDVVFEFTRISTGRGDAFVTTHEITVGQVGAIIAQRGAERALAEVQPHFSPLNDTRAGPRAWVWGSDAHGLPVVQPAPSWLSPSAILAGADYPPGQAPARPGPDSPMQHLRPAAAAYIASLLNCRLPTVAEWQALAAAEDPQVRPGLTNLRDARWGQYREHLANRAAAGRLARSPGEGAFIPAGFPFAFDAGETLAWDDGWLFFAPVAVGTQDATPHVLGNVAEFVTVDVWPVAKNNVDAVRWAAKNAQQLRVIGGSALFHLQMDPFVAHEIDVIDSNEGFADVGFRMAFAAPARSPAGDIASAVLGVLTPTPYLKPR